MVFLQPRTVFVPDAALLLRTVSNDRFEKGSRGLCGYQALQVDALQYLVKNASVLSNGRSRDLRAVSFSLKITVESGWTAR